LSPTFHSILPIKTIYRVTLKTFPKTGKYETNCFRNWNTLQNNYCKILHTKRTDKICRQNLDTNVTVKYKLTCIMYTHFQPCQIHYAVTANAAECGWDFRKKIITKECVLLWQQHNHLTAIIRPVKNWRILWEQIHLPHATAGVANSAERVDRRH